MDMEGEVVLRQSRIGFLQDYFLAGVLFLIILVMQYYNMNINTFGLTAAIAVIAIFILIPEYKKISYKYIISPSRVKTIKGIFRKDREGVSYITIAEVEVHQGFFERMMNIGTIVLGAQSGRGMIQLAKVRNPKKYANMIEKLILKYENKKV